MKAIDIAKSFIGEKEKPNNGGFYNERLQAIMTKAGHNKGEAWCCYFAEGCFCEANPGKEEELRTLFSANCVRTFSNFVKGEQYKYKVVRHPVAGALVLFQRYKNGVATMQGHAAIVDVVKSNSVFTTVEGNTNSAGGREGDSVQPKTRTTAKLDTGLNVLGFVIIEP